MSRRTLIRRFEDATATSPGEWVLQTRMTEARRLLEATKVPIEQVATATGFGSADVLRHHFRTALHERGAIPPVILQRLDGRRPSGGNRSPHIEDAGRHDRASVRFAE
jgi:Helix-turn-helix domain